ncbi:MULTISPECIES: glucose-1-phosphate cytidylyltransferase [Alphaproteobacteria]|uniref:glucose-1-phosphate cytidylyltransferase n=1 Tax=Alphaproteobacteria TaxID=28211 RepID=UPI003297C760
MKVVILAGGLGTRLSEETARLPKPMVEIGGQPILWHIMKIFGHYGLTDFVICLGYKGFVIKEYFSDFLLHRSDVTFDLEAGTQCYLQSRSEPWRVTLVDTGFDTMTGGRVRAVRDIIGDETFCMTYGDGLSDVDIGALQQHHRDNGKLATVTAIRQPGRFGALRLDGASVDEMREKPVGEDNWINGGFFVLEPAVLDRVAGPGTIWEKEPLESLAHDGELSAYRHEGFWQPMDTLREKTMLENAWSTGQAPWKVWK